MSLGLTVSIEDAWGGDITAAAVSHLTASTPERSLLTASFFNDWTTEHVATTRPVSAGGRGSVSLGDGLGIVVEEPSLGGPLFTVGST
jgi:L-alanine-DL-glutamate epimerase-like enolase superfamily enzyme